MCHRFAGEFWTKMIRPRSSVFCRHVIIAVLILWSLFGFWHIIARPAFLCDIVVLFYRVFALCDLPLYCYRTSSWLCRPILLRSWSWCFLRVGHCVDSPSLILFLSLSGHFLLPSSAEIEIYPIEACRVFFFLLERVPFLQLVLLIKRWSSLFSLPQMTLPSSTVFLPNSKRSVLCHST